MCWITGRLRDLATTDGPNGSHVFLRSRNCTQAERFHWFLLQHASAEWRSSRILRSGERARAGH